MERKIFGAKRDEVAGEWRKLHNVELHALYSSPEIIRNIKSRRLRGAGHVARMSESRNAYRVLVRRPEGIRPLGRPRRRWENNIEIVLALWRNSKGYKMASNEKRTSSYTDYAPVPSTSEGDNAGEMSPGSSAESYPAFARIGLRENPRKNLNRATCPDRDSNQGHLVSQPDALTVTPQIFDEDDEKATDTKSSLQTAVSLAEGKSSQSAKFVEDEGESLFSDPEHQYGTIIVAAQNDGRHVLCEIFRSKDGVISLWGIIKQHVSKHGYQTIEDSKQAVREAFREITPPLLRKFHTGHGAASFCAATMMKCYSSDLSPCDFDLIPLLKKPLRWKRFANREDILTAFRREVVHIDESHTADGIQRLHHRWQRCVEVLGEYIERC
ncbi:hypothetical protein ANN_13268 [Periplaneta americana]|uniref:Uncharacterized protein n=1 Tax=Periplaneta americana TaxID=6978 RepID=A0ABQ8TKB8_PERAM|nr:hypothetical protein ANN_13268 [Periplaneta americana]